MKITIVGRWGIRTRSSGNKVEITSHPLPSNPFSRSAGWCGLKVDITSHLPPPNAFSCRTGWCFTVNWRSFGRIAIIVFGSRVIDMMVGPHCNVEQAFQSIKMHVRIHIYHRLQPTNWRITTAVSWYIIAISSVCKSCVSNFPQYWHNCQCTGLQFIPRQWWKLYTFKLVSKSPPWKLVPPLDASRIISQTTYAASVDKDVG